MQTSFLPATLILLLGFLVPFPAVATDQLEGGWVGPMREVHARFKGSPGTFAHFGDSITVTLAFWAGLESQPKNTTGEAARAYELVKRYQKPDCWRHWKGPEFGNNGSMTVRWAEENLDGWLAKLNPEVALIMFGSNDVVQMEVQEYAAKTRSVAERCLNNGTVVILSTMPPRSGHVQKSARFAEAVRKIAADLRVPLSDYHAEILKRRPDDWDGSSPNFTAASGDVYEVPTLISRDGVHPSNPGAFAGDFSEHALRTNGFGLRNHITLMSYAAVIEEVLSPR
ncbi:MAG: SGNH/GDSL hydrolase family protein [Verrucomicrobiota bacterium]